jgi:isoleucyl-tRNA synthetase
VWKPWSGARDEGLEDVYSVVSTLSAAIKSAQERLRADKRIGSGLESGVTVYLSQSSFDAFAALTSADTDAMEEQLASLFVVSGFDVRVDGSDANVSHAWSVEEVVPPSENIACLAGGARVVVHEPPGPKCPRCWRFVKAAEKGEEDLCGRCEGVVSG